MDDFVKQAVKGLLKAIDTGSQDDLNAVDDLYRRKNGPRWVRNALPVTHFVRYVRGLTPDHRQLIINGIAG